VPLSPSSASFPEGLLEPLLAISLTGVNLLRPLYDSAGILDDFATEYLNPAAQRMTGLPERPDGTMRSRFPETFRNGVFAFYRRVFETGEASRYELNYQADGFDNYFQVAACRSGDWLVVSFTDTADQPRTPVELALRESQAAAKAARAEAELQRQRFYDVLMQLPAHVALHEGPDQTFTLVNPAYRRIANERDLVGQPIREAWPELASHGILDVLDGVYQTGEPYIAAEVPVQADFTRTGQLEEVYYDFFFLPLRDAQRQVTGVLNYSYDVTASVRARRQVEDLNEQLAAQQRRLGQILRQAPAMLATFEGPDHRFTFTNPGYDALVGHRARLGASVAECLPEEVAQGFVDLLDGVYRTGRPHVGYETHVAFQPPGEAPVTYYVDFTYQPLTDAQGQPSGILAFIVDVTEQVRARQHADALQAELLAATQRHVQERETLYQVFEQTPAMVQLLRGPHHHVAYVNPAYQRLFPGRPLVGLDLAEAVPELREQGFIAILDDVYQTGETYFGLEVPLLIEQPDGWPPRTGYLYVYVPALPRKRTASRHLSLRPRGERASAGPPGAGRPTRAGAGPAGAGGPTRAGRTPQPGAGRHQRRAAGHQRRTGRQQPAAHPRQHGPGQLHLHRLARPQGSY